MPEMELEGTRINLVEKNKLLGVVLTINLTWEANTDYIVKRCNDKIWILRRLKKLGANHSDLLDVYFKQIRSIAEFAAPVWNSALTGVDIAKLERIQKTAFHVILSEDYRSYSSALSPWITEVVRKEKTALPQLCQKGREKPQIFQMV